MGAAAKGQATTIKHLTPDGSKAPVKEVKLLPSGQKLSWDQQGEDLQVQVPSNLETDSIATVFEVVLR
ncbi:MAG: hypothetical protein AAF804_02490 [Bacteroidota bacterium]